MWTLEASEPERPLSGKVTDWETNKKDRRMFSAVISVPLEPHQMVSKGHSAFWDTVRSTLSFPIGPHPSVTKQRDQGRNRTRESNEHL